MFAAYSQIKYRSKNSVLEEATDNITSSNKAKAPIRPMKAGSIFLRQAFDSKKLVLSDALVSLIV